MDSPKTIVLLAHDPQEATREYLKTLPNTTVYLYGLNVGVHSVQDDVITTLKRINKDVNLSQFGRVILSPPGSSTTAILFAAGLRGITGVNIEVLYLPRSDETGEHAPLPGKEIISSNLIYNVMRKTRPMGPVLTRRETQGVISVHAG